MTIYKISQLGNITPMAVIEKIGYAAVQKFREIVGDGEFTNDPSIPVVSGFRIDIDGYLYAYVGIVTVPTKRSWELAHLYANIGAGRKARN